MSSVREPEKATAFCSLHRVDRALDEGDALRREEQNAERQRDYRDLVLKLVGDRKQLFAVARPPTRGRRAQRHERDHEGEEAPSARRSEESFCLRAARRAPPLLLVTRFLEHLNHVSLLAASLIEHLSSRLALLLVMLIF